MVDDRTAELTTALAAAIVDEETARRALSTASDTLISHLTNEVERLTAEVERLTAPEPATTTCDAPPPVVLLDENFQDGYGQRWRAYGTKNGPAEISNERWGQSTRSGFYAPEAIDISATDGLVVTTQPDPQGRTSQNGRPGWQTGFLETRGMPGGVYPTAGRYEVRARFDPIVGHWPAPLWLRLSPGGAGAAEVDVMEWFGANDPDAARQGRASPH